MWFCLGKPNSALLYSPLVIRISLMQIRTMICPVKKWIWIRKIKKKKIIMFQKMKYYEDPELLKFQVQSPLPTLSSSLKQRCKLPSGTARTVSW